MFLENYLVSLEPVDVWCKKYDLEQKKTKCRKCGKELVTNVPFFTKEFRGLFAKECSCGNKNTPFTFTFEDLK